MNILIALMGEAVRNIRVNEIDLLRFLATLGVVFFHYAFRGHAADGMSAMSYPLLMPAAKYGYLGVELFFMISGFVILMSAEGLKLRDFAIARIVRLYPAFWACCTITFLTALAIGGERYVVSLGQYLVNMTMMSGFLDIPSIDGVYWSLFIEIQFYCMVALIIATGLIARVEWLMLAWLGMTFVLFLFPVHKLQLLLIGDYAPLFVAGAACYLIWQRGLTWMRALLVLLSWGLALQAAITKMLKIQAHYSEPLSAEVVMISMSVFFLIMLLVAFKRTGAVGRANWILLGALTYPVYMLHQHIGYMVFNLAYLQIDTHLLFWGTIALIMLIAYGVHILVEKKTAKPMKIALNHMAERMALYATRWRSRTA